MMIISCVRQDQGPPPLPKNRRAASRRGQAALHALSSPTPRTLPPATAPCVYSSRTALARHVCARRAARPAHAAARRRRLLPDPAGHADRLRGARGRRRAAPAAALRPPLQHALRRHHRGGLVGRCHARHRSGARAAAPERRRAHPVRHPRRHPHRQDAVVRGQGRPGPRAAAGRPGGVRLPDCAQVPGQPHPVDPGPALNQGANLPFGLWRRQARNREATRRRGVTCGGLSRSPNTTRRCRCASSCMRRASLWGGLPHLPGRRFHQSGCFANSYP